MIRTIVAAGLIAAPLLTAAPAVAAPTPPPVCPACNTRQTQAIDRVWARLTPTQQTRVDTFLTRYGSQIGITPGGGGVVTGAATTNTSAKGK
ncbi:MAG: hypothetical protein JO044_02900 [Mycobacteriaceae bacterium]|nr:hypothetical protein [Mycobacteriaceae bacterium]